MLQPKIKSIKAIEPFSLFQELATMKRKVVTILATVLLIQAFAQENPTTDFFAQIKNYDLSVVMTADSIFDDDEKMYERSEILGFICDNYQRLHIHFISIIQNPSDPYEYFAYGKTKVKENISSFQGTMKVTKSKLYKESDVPIYKQGYAELKVNLYEDSKQNSTGFFSGKLTANFMIDKKDVLKYDALISGADGFCNNQFVGTWTSYKTKSTKKSNWGDYRIPESGDLDDIDIGIAEFYVNDKYVKNGWENYKLAFWNSDPETPEAEKARQKEKE
jgi:hypothetical protein